MKRSFAIFFAVLSLSILFNIERRQEGVCDGVVPLQLSLSLELEDDHSFEQGDNFTDLNGRRGSSKSFSSSAKVIKSGSPRRNALDILSGVKIATADLYSQSSYSYSCDFPFEHRSQRELFYTLRNIRI